MVTLSLFKNCDATENRNGKCSTGRSPHSRSSRSSSEEQDTEEQRLKVRAIMKNTVITFLSLIAFFRCRLKKRPILLFVLVWPVAHAVATDDALPSWNDGPAKSAIIGFVQATTDKSSSKFVPPAERIATFDQDGTLWVSHPMYAQVVYCLDRHQHDERLEAHIRVRAIAPERQDETGNVAAQGSGFGVQS